MDIKFKKGDRIEYNDPFFIGAVDVEVLGQITDRLYEVQDLNNKNIFRVDKDKLSHNIRRGAVLVIEDSPFTQNISGGHLHLYTNSLDHCPKCHSKWVITQFESNTWYDCTTCNQTKEQIEKQSGTTRLSK